MGAIFAIQGILIYIYAKARHIHFVNDFIDKNEDEIMKIWDKAQRGEKIEKINR